jgi:uncharacterized protein
VLSGDNDHPDLANVRELSGFPELRFLDRFKWLPTFATGVLCGLLFGWSGVVWGLGVATTLAFHAPLFVNSAGHLWGTRRFETKDSSRNNALLGAWVLGDGTITTTVFGPPRLRLVGDRRHVLRHLVARQGRSGLGGANAATLDRRRALGRVLTAAYDVCDLPGRSRRDETRRPQPSERRTIAGDASIVAPCVAMSSETLHEPAELLSEPTKNMHRAIVSLIEELQAVDWYQQRAEACSDDDLRAVLLHNKNEEIEHAMMNLEWIRRHSAVFDANIATYINSKGSILAAEKKASGSEGSGEAASPASSLGIGSLKDRS